MRDRWKKALLDRPIGVKMNLFYVSLIIVPFLAIALVFSYVLGDVLLARMQDRSESGIDQSLRAIEMNLSELDSIMVSNLWDSTLTAALKSPSALDDAQSRAVMEKLRSMANSRRDILFLMIERRDGQRSVFSTINESSLETDILSGDKNLSDEERLSRGKTLWFDCPGDLHAVLGIRKIFDFETLDELGELYIVLDEASILRQYAGHETTPGSFFVLQDPHGRIVSENGVNGYDISDLERASISNQRVRLNGASFYRNARLSDEIGWTVSLFTPVHEVVGDVQRMVMLLFGAMLMLISLLLVITTRFARSITAPLGDLQDKMQAVRNEQFDIRADETRGDELGAIARTFNAMTSRIQKLIDEDYRNKLLIQETEYKFLRAQINPHFLYNTLDSINWMAAMDGNRDVSRMAVALGRILRWSISNTRSLVRLREDVEIIEDYLTIQKMRYGESLSYGIHIGEAEGELMIPKMILQPLVENALVHGLEDKDGDKRIDITAERQGDALIVTISDNGVGMSEERLETMLRGLEARDNDQPHIGIHNVHRRIRMLFGERYGLSIESKLNQGTRMLVLLPVNRGKEEEE